MIKVPQFTIGVEHRSCQSRFAILVGGGVVRSSRSPVPNGRPAQGDVGDRGVVDVVTQTGEDFPEFVARSAEPSQVTDVQAAIDVQVDVPELLKHVCLA
jgi:hypothetical protein